LVKDVEISPHTPRPGDPLYITFRGDCGERFPVELIYEQTVQAAGGSFTVQMNGILVPWHRNSLVMDARYVSSMSVAAKFLLWISKRAEVSNGVGKYTMTDVPEGNYNVKLTGTPAPGACEIKVRITAKSELRTDAKGTCAYIFHTAPQNTGNLTVRCSGLENRVDIRK
jgi:hypothetical protein